MRPLPEALSVLRKAFLKAELEFLLLDPAFRVAVDLAKTPAEMDAMVALAESILDKTGQVNRSARQFRLEAKLASEVVQPRHDAR